MKNLLILAPVFLLFYSISAMGTHINGGEITYKSLDAANRTYEFTLAIYRDSGPGSVDQPEATLNFGDGSPCQTQPLQERITIGPQTEKLTYVFTHSFPGDARYVVSFNEENRIANINNINDGNSVQISFYTEATILVDGFMKPNNSFQFLGNPILEGVTGQVFSHTLAGMDPDGDSLGFKFTVSKAFNAGEEGCGSAPPFIVPNYKLPNHENFYQGPLQDIPREFSINPFSGNIYWNAPGNPGIYNVAVIVQEFRKNDSKWQLLGYTTRDLAVIIRESDFRIELEKIDTNQVKEFNVIDLIENEALELKVRVSNSSGNQVFLEAYSELFVNQKATFETYDGEGFKEGKLSFTFDSSFIRDSPYIVTFRGKLDPHADFAILEKDLTYILNPKKGKIFKYETTPINPQNPTADEEGVYSRVIPAYPNPAKGSFFINTIGLKKPEIVIYNTEGQIQKSEKLKTSEKAEVQANDLKPGLYLYEIKASGKEKGNGKVIIE